VGLESAGQGHGAAGSPAQAAPDAVPGGTRPRAARDSVFPAVVIPRAGLPERDQLVALPPPAGRLWWLPMRTTAALVAALVSFAAGTSVAADHDCQHDDSHDGVVLRRVAEKVVAWRESRLPATADPSRWLKVKLLGINDFHGALAPRKLGTADVGGAAVLGAYLEKAAAAASGPTFIVHAGDHVGASPPSSALLQDEPSVSFLNLLGNSHCGRGRRRLHPRCNLVGTFGNHEFDEGTAEMLRLIDRGNHARGPFLEKNWGGAHFPYVSANVVDADSGVPIVPPFVVKRVSDRVNIAIVGAVLEGTPTIVTPAGVDGVKFLDEADAINRYIPFIRALGIKTVIVTIHQGGFQTNNAAGGPGPATALDGPEIKDIVSRLDAEVDVVISGHRHQFTNTLLPNAGSKPVLVTQAFASGTAYADIDLEIDPRTREVMTKQARVITTFHKNLAGNPMVTPSPAIAALVAAAEARVAPIVDEVVATAGRAITQTQNAAGESGMGNLIADAQRWKMGTDFAFMNPGGVRASLDAGPVTWGELFTVQPFGNDLVTMNLSGQQIVDLLAQQFVVARVLQVSGLRFGWTDSGTPGPSGGTLVSVARSDGTPLDLAATYSVTINSFLAGGGDGFTVLTAGTNRVIGPVDLDALVEYLRQLGQPFDTRIDGRVTLVP
jgi:5'-nucleotidase